MIEVMAVLGMFQVIVASVNIVVCIWEHDTHTLLPWMLSFLGWAVVSMQMFKRMGEK